MQLPDTIRLQVNCGKKCNLAGLIFQMRVQSGTKNSYTILLPKTDQNGLAILSAENLRDQFEDHHHFALMDYNGSIEAACQAVEINLLDVKQMARSGVLGWPLMPRDEKTWKSKKQRSDYFLSASNDKFFFFPVSVKIEEGKIIETTVGKMWDSAKS
jgi:hypothetical protein